MKGKRRAHSDKFKAKIAIEANKAAKASIICRTLLKHSVSGADRKYGNVQLYQSLLCGEYHQKGHQLTAIRTCHVLIGEGLSPVCGLSDDF
ncbi:hypothetical protein JYT85_00850 [Desulfocapsa sp. AH-315-G09]|uniref:Transposase n=1 Tax=Desulfotalea psychrophila TaxID=84980 RepID=A0ABS3AYN4_9BACT|nr:hypothetical protein [Desulfocapsa sp.]MBN4048573.1 hypothetical protein [bacterium AH-315-N22]MBN4065181.1 hypothetical protein [Desulfocapsa sp. AH-315-G09]MBN4068987.1 hypothetical protein [Desulfotalea psychrophila]